MKPFDAWSRVTNQTMKITMHRHWSRRLHCSLGRVMMLLLLWTRIYCAKFLPAIESLSIQQDYSDARTVRSLHGHRVAMPLYRDLWVKDNLHDVTAATWIASHPDAPKRHGRLGDISTVTPDELQNFTSRLREWHFTPLGIAEHIFDDSSISEVKWNAQVSTAPLYVKPLRAGSKAPPCPKSALDTCIQLFLMARCVPFSMCQQYLGHDTVQWIQSLGLAFCDHSPQGEAYIVPYCHITPVKPYDSTLSTLYFATDLHPNVLSSTVINDEEGTQAVMYIGPDSLALVDHWTMLPHRQSSDNNNSEIIDRVVDVGTGSGIQALTMAASLQSAKSSTDRIEILCIDLNPRALQLARLNFAWNRFPEPELVLGDINDHRGGCRWKESSSLSSLKPWDELLGRPTMLLANPPFLPVPVRDTVIAKRHGYFSSGGASGEDILTRIIQIASTCLEDNDHSVAAIVSEFMNPQTSLPTRLREWWGNESMATGVLFTNQEALDAPAYSERRADSSSEFETWIEHLASEEITHISPGLLFLKSAASNKETEANSEIGLQIQSHLIPKTKAGSIWTPTNLQSRQFILNKLKELEIFPPMLP